MSKHLYWLDMGIFPGTVLFSHGFKHTEICSLLKKKKATDWLAGIADDQKLFDSGSWLGCKRELNNTKTGQSKTLYYIHIPVEFKFTDTDYCKLAHEIIHICQFHLPDILNRNEEIEAEAYLHTYIMENCLKVMRNAK